MGLHIPDIQVEKIHDSKLRQQIEQLFQVVEYLFSEVERLKKENQQLKDAITQLKQQPKRPQLPSVDYSATKRDKKQNKQWHKGKKKDAIHIDQVVKLSEVKTCICGSQNFLSLRTVEKLIQDIVIATNNTLYQGRDKKCRQCGKLYIADIPPEVKGVQFGSVLRSWISCCKFDFRMSEGMIHRFMTGLGIQISSGQISNILLSNGTKLTDGFTYLVVEGIKKAQYVQTDATMHKRKRSIHSHEILHHHLHFIGHAVLSIFKITRRYNSTAIHSIIGKRAREKPIVSDDASSYGNRFVARYKQLCWIHEIRHYLKLTPLIKRHKKVVAEVLDQIWKWYAQAKSYKDIHTQGQKAVLSREFDRIVSQNTGYRELDHRLALTNRKKERLLLFLDYPFLPIHNNQSERDVREAVLIRTISRETKSDLGDKSLAKHLSIIQTARKQGLNVFDTIHGLLTNTLSPAVLTARTV